MSANFSDEDYRERVKQNYDFPAWVGRTKEGGSTVRVTGFDLTTKAENRFAVEQKEDLPPSSRQQRVTRYVSTSAQHQGQRFITTIFECKSVTEAHETLIDVVMTYMAPKLPTCETRGLPIGDICFAGHGEVNLLVIFARFNILVEVKSATPGPTSVDEFARTIDALILDQFRTQAPG